MTHRMKHGVGAPALTVAAILLSGCGRKTESLSGGVVSRKVERRDIVECCSEDGVLKAFRTLAMYPETGDARLTAVRVKEGDAVKKGDVLYLFETNRVGREIQLLQVRIEAACIKLDVLKTRREAADRAEARQLFVQAQQELEESKRALTVQEQLVELGLGARTERDALRARHEAAALGAQRAKSRVEEIDRCPRSFEIADVEAQRLQYENEREKQRLIEKDCVGVAPFDGVVLEVSDVVKDLNISLENVSLRFWPSGGPLVTIADIDSMRVMGNFFEREIARIRVGQKALISAIHVPGKVFEGTVTHIGERGSLRGQTSVVAVEVAAENPEHRLRPGLTAEMRIVVDEKKGVPAIPVEYLRRGSEGAWVWRKEAGGAKRRVPVNTGISDGRYVEIVSGLRENDVVVME